MSHDLGPDARALLEEGRTAHDPTSADRARVKKALLASIAAGAASAAAEASAASSASGASSAASAVSTGSAIGVKIAGAIAVVGLVAAASFAIVTGEPETKMPVPESANVESAPEAKVVEPTPVVEPEATPVEAPVVERVPENVPRTRVQRKTKPAPIVEAPMVDASTLAAEAKLLSSVRIALSNERYEDVLTSVDAHAVQFPNGHLRQEALAARALALCGLGRNDEARTAREALAGLAPKSAHLARIEAACR